MALFSLLHPPVYSLLMGLCNNNQFICHSEQRQAESYNLDG